MTDFKRYYESVSKEVVHQYPNHHILIFGRPGAGKGVLADVFAETGFVHVGVGKLIRKHLRENTSVCKRFDSELSDKLIVPDALASDMILPELQQILEEQNSFFVLEGYPVTQGQYAAFKDFVESNAVKLVVILLDVTEIVAEQRLLNRKTCPHCHRAYSMSDERCWLCGDVLYKREDDQLHLIQERQALFAKKTYPLRKQFESAFPSIIKSSEKTF